MTTDLIIRVIDVKSAPTTFCEFCDMSTTTTMDTYFPNDLRLSCVCVLIGTTCNIYLYVVVFLGWEAV